LKARAVKSNRSHSTAAARIVALGGGTGLSTLLRGLKEYVAPRSAPRGQHHKNNKFPASGCPIGDLAAIVTVTDDGGSSGRLRREYRILPPGDIRNCMVALSADEALLGQLFQYRFHAGRGLRGHSFGNLFLAALSHVTGDFNEAVRLSGEVLAIRGRIFPSTIENVNLEAVLENGRRVLGETRISRSTRRIRGVSLVPPRVRPLPEALQAIAGADVILLGPGSLYTSVLPNLLIPQIAEAIAKSSATCVYIANLMTQPGETPGYSVADHVRAIHKHTRCRLIDWVIVNRKPVSPGVARRYRTEGAVPVACDVKELQKLGVRVVFDDLLEEHGVIRHNSRRLTELLLKEFVRGRRAR
jgi:uncharacterized cofD-like protein